MKIWRKEDFRLLDVGSPQVEDDGDEEHDENKDWDENGDQEENKDREYDGDRDQDKKERTGMRPGPGIWRRTRTDEDLDQDESHRLTFRSIVWMSDPPLLGSNLVSARHPVPCSQRYTLSFSRYSKLGKYPIQCAAVEHIL